MTLKTRYDERSIVIPQVWAMVRSRSNKARSVLVVDDNPDVLFATSRIIKKAGYRVIEAATGAECMDHVRRHHPDMVLLDVVLPDADGMALAEQIKSDPHLKQTFVVLLSGQRITSEDKIKGLNCFADGYITRPVSNKELLANIDAFFRINQLITELRASKEHVHTTLKSIGDAVVTTDHEGLIDSLNPAAEILSGWSESEAKGKPFEEVIKLIDEKTRVARRSIVGEVLVSRTIQELAKPTLLVTRDGSEIPVADTAAPISGSTQGVTGVVVVLQNVTQDRARETALEQSKREWETIFQAIGHPTLILDPDHTIVEANAAAISVSNATEKNGEGIIGRKCHEVYHGTGFPPPCCPLEMLKKSGHMERADMEIEIWGGIFMVSCTPIYDDDGDLDKIIHIATDITKRKESELKARQSEAMLKSVLDATPFPVAVVDVDDEQIYFWSKSAVDLFGHTAPTAAEWYQLAYPDPRYRREIIENQWKPALKKARESGETVNSGEYEVTCADGSIRLCELYARFFPEFLIVTFRDITEARKAKRELEASDKRWRDVISESPIGIALYDENGQCIAANESIGSIIGATVEQVLNQNYHHIDSWKKAGMYDSALKAVREKSKTRFQFEAKTTFDRSVFLDCIFVPYGSDGLMVMAVDNSDKIRAEHERKRLEDQLIQAQKMESIGRLAGGVAHDFNNVLTAIQGFSELIQESLSQDDPLKKDVAEIQKAAGSAATLTNQLLAFSRKQIVSPRVLDLNETISESKKMLKRIIGEDVDFVFKPDKGMGRVFIDPGQLDQILINLSVNSRDAMPQGGKLTIETKGVALEDEKCDTCGAEVVGEYAMLSVSDSGVGMDKETCIKIFEPFFTTKEASKGTGLGLSTVHGIVHQNQGHITLVSQPGKGTTFGVFFPVIHAKLERVEEQSGVGDIAGDETILVVEDQDLVRRLAVRTLAKYGYRVIDAENGGAAVLRFEQQGTEIDLLVTDVVMPEMSGKQLYDRLLNINPKLRALFMSGYAEETIAHHGILEEGINFIQKPFRPRELAKKARLVLDARKQR